MTIEEAMKSLFEQGTVYTLAEASGKLKVSRVTLIRSIEKGKLSAFRVGIQWRVRGEDLNRFVAQTREEAAYSEQ